MGAVDDAEIDAGRVQPLVKQPRQHRGRAVDRGRARIAHPDGAPPAGAVFLGQHVVVALGHLRTAGLLDEIENGEGGLDHMAVRVDHRMIEPGPDNLNKLL